MEYTLTERHVELFTRHLKWANSDINLKLSMNDDFEDGIEPLTLEPFKLVVSDIEVDDFGDGPFAMYSVYVTCNDHEIISYLVDSESYEDIRREENVFEHMKKNLIGKTFHGCKLPFCTKVLHPASKEQDGMCKDDYIFHYNREEDCAICMTNGGSWTKIDCGHFIHTSCFDKGLRESRLKKAFKCPLCRHVPNHKLVIRNFPFL